jgi:hypothetical protein
VKTERDESGHWFAGDPLPPIDGFVKVRTGRPLVILGYPLLTGWHLFSSEKQSIALKPNGSDGRCVRGDINQL